MASENFDQASRNAGINKVEEKIFGDQLLANFRRLQRYRQFSPEYKSTSCSLQKEALQALYRIYSFGLRPANLSETPLETLLQDQLIELIHQPYGIYGSGSGNPSAVLIMEGPKSPFWDLHDWSLKLIRSLIDNGHLSAGTMKIIEDCLTKLLVTIQECLLKGQACPRRSKNIAIIAHCLCRIFKRSRPTESTQRQLLSTSFICYALFPLACEFAAKEYPASIVDPIGYYELFESSGKLVEPDEALVEWNRRNKSKTAPENSDNSSKRIKLEDECSDLEDDDVDSLPPAHVCLEHLIYQLTMSSNQTDQGVIVKFLRGKVSYIQDQRNSDSIDRSRTGSEVLMNKIVALHVLGRVRLQPIPSEEINFFETLVLPKLKQDCLKLKICKFQLVRFLKMDDQRQLISLTQAFLHEFMKIMEIEDYQDERNKLFIIFASVASEYLHKLWDCERFDSSFNSYLTPLDHESQLILVKKITNLYLDYKIVAPLALVDIIYEKDQSEDFSDNIERLMAKVIDSIAAELLVISHASDRAQNLSEHLYRATCLRGLLLPDTTVDKLVKLVRLRMLSDNHSLWHGYNLETSTYLDCVLRNPLKERTKSLAIDIMDRFLTEPLTNDTDKMYCVTKILGNLCYNQVTSSTLASISSNSGTGTGDMHDQHYNRNPPFGSYKRMRDILALCDRMERQTDLTTKWVMSILMSWPSFREVARIERPSKLSSIKLMWDHFVDFAIRISGKFHSHEILFVPYHSLKRDDYSKYRTRLNILFALMAAFNYDPKRLENYLNYVIGPVGSGQSHISEHVKLWLNVITRTSDNFMCSEWHDKGFVYRSYMVISHQALINIHRAQTAGKLGFSIMGLKSKLNSARQFVLKWLADIRQQAIKIESPLENFYAHYIGQLEAISSFR